MGETPSKEREYHQKNPSLVIQDSAEGYCQRNKSLVIPSPDEKVSLRGPKPSDTRRQKEGLSPNEGESSQWARLQQLVSSENQKPGDMRKPSKRVVARGPKPGTTQILHDSVTKGSKPGDTRIPSKGVIAKGPRGRQ